MPRIPSRCVAIALLCACNGGEAPTTEATGETTTGATSVATPSSTGDATTASVTDGPEPTTSTTEAASTSTTDATGDPGSTGAAETSADTGEGPLCPAAGRFDVERFSDADVALIDDLVFSSGGASLDLYVPDATMDACATRPVLLMVHGGAWVLGQKEWMAARARFHARRGIVVATIDYRKTDFDALCSGDGWNRAGYRAMQDVYAAAQQLVATADQYAIDPAAMFLYGNSAGSMTTLSLALGSEAAVADVFADLIGGEGPLGAQSLHPDAEVAIRAMYTQAGAVLSDELVDVAAAPALLLLHSKDDASVPFTNGGSAVCPDSPISVFGSSWIADAVDGSGECVALVEVEGDVHDLDEVYGERCDSVDDPCEPSRLDDTAARFFSAVMAGGCGSQRSLCTATDCQLQGGDPPQWFTLFP